MNWLTINDYSNKYDLSVSTLRRRIKAEDIEFRLESGKYFLLDEEPRKQKAQKTSEKIQKIPLKHKFEKENLDFKTEESSDDEQAELLVNAAVRSSSEMVTNQDEQNIQSMRTAADSAFTTAKELLDELKKSYSFILHEKEEQILYLKNEISDLRTLIRVLEDDNTKLRQYVEHLHTIQE
ncbi:MAG: hypothetical protein VX583_09510 [Bdellovibrionota bacterium]|nr:hypothetical protein [Pseudobdellovibrionaceae bacterium]|tara:strand:- start:39264 stop:39803 length:540 start_codon:yes stop_codon:yes gene_type:complete